MVIYDFHTITCTYKSHTHTTLVRKVANDKAKEDCVIARGYQRKEFGRRKSWLRFVLKLQIGNLDIESSLEIQKLGENEGKREFLSLLQPQQLKFSPNSWISQVQVVQHILTFKKKNYNLQLHHILVPFSTLIVINIISRIVRSSNAPLYTQPTINRPTQQDLVVVKYDNGICKPN